MASLRKVYEQYGAKLLLYARQWCAQPEDALQDAFLDLIRKQPPPEEPVAWLFQAVRFRAMNVQRRETRQARHRKAQESQSTEPWFQPQTGSQLESAEVVEALQYLSNTEREIVVARVWCDLTFEQIAVLVDSSSSSVHRRYEAALETLSKRLSSSESNRQILS